MSTIDVSALVASIEATGQVRDATAGDTVAIDLAPETTDTFAALLTHYQGKRFPVPASLVPDAIADRSDSNRAQDLATALRQRLCKVSGGDGRFVWISGYSDAKTPGVIWLAAREKVVMRSNDGKAALAAGLVTADGTLVQPSA